MSLLNFQIILALSDRLVHNNVFVHMRIELIIIG